MIEPFKSKRILELEALEVGCVKSHFLDSGAFSLWGEARKYAQETGRPSRDYFYSDGFWDYMDDYAKFVKENRVAIDHYANVDVIRDPELTWRNQRYLEDEHGLDPVPAFHYPNDLKWFRKYVDLGYEYIGLGGLIGKLGESSCLRWLDSCFNYICSGQDRTPSVKIHGFAVTSFQAMISYPWYSVDSATWVRAGAYGMVLIPRTRGGEFVFNTAPMTVNMSCETPTGKKWQEKKENPKVGIIHEQNGKVIDGYHYLGLPPTVKRMVDDWMEYIDIPLGKIDRNGEVLEVGVLTRHLERRAANVFYFHHLQQHLPEWPWPFIPKGRRREEGFGF